MKTRPLSLPGRYVFLDFETTTSPTGHRPVEVAAIALVDGGIAEEFVTLINPRCPIDPRCEAVHGIMDRNVRDAPDFEEIWPGFSQGLDGSVVVAHNASFDSSVLRNEIRRFGLTPPRLEWWCTCKIARSLWPHFPSHSLGVLASILRLEGDNSHRAEYDVRLTIELFQTQLLAASEKRIKLPEGLRERALHTSRNSWPF